MFVDLLAKLLSGNHWDLVINTVVAFIICTRCVNFRKVVER